MPLSVQPRLAGRRSPDQCGVICQAARRQVQPKFKYPDLRLGSFDWYIVSRAFCHYPTGRYPVKDYPK
jgi:hypothetical protein